MSAPVFRPPAFQRSSVVTSNRAPRLKGKVVLGLRSVSLDIPQAEHERSWDPRRDRDVQLLKLAIVLAKADVLPSSSATDRSPGLIGRRPGSGSRGRPFRSTGHALAQWYRGGRAHVEQVALPICTRSDRSYYPATQSIRR